MTDQLELDALPKILFRSGPLRGQVLVVERDRTSLGRDARNDVAIHDEIVSSFHAAIIREDARFFLEDLGSKNGTFLNGQRIHREELKDGDVFCLCQTGPEIQFTQGKPKLPTILESTTNTFARTRSLTRALRELFPHGQRAETPGISLTGVRRILDYKLEESTRRARIQIAVIAAVLMGVLACAILATVVLLRPQGNGTSGGAPLAAMAPRATGFRLDLRVEPLYGSFFLLYRDTPIGEVDVINESPEALEGAQVFLEFQEEAANFLREPFAAPVPSLPAGGSVRIGLSPKLSTALLSAQIREVTVRVALRKADVELASSSRAVFVHDRNVFSWEQPERIAVFVDPRDPGVRELAEQLLARRPATSREEFPPPRLVEALTILTGLASRGLQYRSDPGNPLSERIDSHANDQVNYPGQTLLSGSGDCDDLSVLCCAVLEAAAIPTALAVGPGHVLFLIDTGIPVEGLNGAPLDPETTLAWKDRIWLPIEATDLARPGASFATAWAAAWPLREALATEAWRKIDLREAWRSYQPMTVPPDAGRLEKLAQVAQAAATGLEGKVEAGLERLAQLLRENLGRKLEGIVASSTPGAERDHAVGRCYAESGLLTEAIQSFERGLFADRDDRAKKLEQWKKEISEGPAVLLTDLAFCLGLRARGPEDLEAAATYGELALGAYPEGTRERGELMLRVALLHRLRGDLALERAWSGRAISSDPTLGETYRRMTEAGGPVAGPTTAIRAYLRKGIR